MDYKIALDELISTLTLKSYPTDGVVVLLTESFRGYIECAKPHLMSHSGSYHTFMGYPVLDRILRAPYQIERKM